MSYKLEIPWEHYQRLQFYVDNIDTEVGGFGCVKLEKDIFKINEVFLVEQEAQAVECTTTSLGADRIIAKLIEEEREDEFKLWWHSHVNMSVGFSGTDTTTMNKWPGDWLIAIVLNKKRQIAGRLQIMKPVPMYVDMEIEIVYPEIVGSQELLEEIKAKVKPKAVPVNNYKWTPEKKWENGPTPIHRMTGAEYEELMLEGFDVMGDKEEKKWEDWSERYLKAANDLNVDEQMCLLEEAIREDILTIEEVTSYLADGEEIAA